MQEFLAEFSPVPDSAVKFQPNSWLFLDIAQVPYHELRLIPNIGQAKVNGFVNHGVSCYMNVVFQTLCNMPGLKEYFLGNIHLKEFQQRGHSPLEDNFVNRIAELVQLYHSYNDFVLEPLHLVSEIKSHSKTFSAADTQHDAHEFLMYVLDRLASGLNRYARVSRGQVVDRQADVSVVRLQETPSVSETASNSKARGGSQKKIKKKPSKRNSIRDSTAEKENHKNTISPSAEDEPEIRNFEEAGKSSRIKDFVESKPGQDRDSLELLGQKQWGEHLAKNQSIVSDVLLGQFMTKLECVACQSSSFTFEPFTVLELPLPPGRGSTTFANLLHSFTKEDVIEGSEWDCPSCRVKRQVRKTTEIFRLPPVLVIYYKRFEFARGQSKKNDCLVTMKIEGEDLSRFEHGAASPKVYAPYMFIVKSTEAAPPRRHRRRPLQLHLLRQPGVDGDRRLLHPSPQRPRRSSPA